MKARTLLFLTALALASGSCAKYIESADLQGEQLTFTACAAGPETKTVLQDDGVSLWWAPGDEINLFYGSSASSKFTAQNKEAAKIASFTGTLNVATGTIEAGHEGKEFWGVYPYSAGRVCGDSSVTISVPATQQPAAGEFPTTLFPSIAKSTSLNLAFYNVCGGLKFSVYHDDIKSITFKATGGQTIAGDVKVGFGDDGKPAIAQVLDGMSEIVITPAEGDHFEAGKYYYVVMLPAVLSEGFQIVVSKGDAVDVKDKSSQIVIARSTFGVLSLLDKDSDFVSVPEIGDYIKEFGEGVVYAVEDDYVFLVSLTEAHDLTWTNAVSWCKSYGDGGWYLPSIDELKILQKQVDVVNNTLEGIYGSQVLYTGNKCYWSSTENGKYAWRMKMDDGQTFSEGNDELKTSTKNYTRAIRKVSIDSLEQSVTDSDLSANGTANCYIVSVAGTYKFKATVKGNSTESIGTPVSAEVLWESFGTDVAPKVGDIITSVSFADDYVTFSTPVSLANGNAVIAVKDANGTILWSWHIWACKCFDPSTTQLINNKIGTSMMDRNLGAACATPGDVGALGLLYQWGRKDPFLNGNGISSTTVAASTCSLWPTDDSGDGTIAYTVKNPTAFICRGKDWCSNTYETRWDIYLKSIYDPCPPGWKVLRNNWLEVFGVYFSGSGWNGSCKGMSFGSYSSGYTWFPAAGYRCGDGELIEVGGSGNVWSSYLNSGLANILHFNSLNEYSGNYYRDKSCGMSVRCCKE